MAWVKLDDAFLDHPKFLAAGPLAGYLAITAIAWSNRNLMDGFIPAAQVPRLVNFDGFAHRMWSGELAGGGEDAEPQALASQLVDIGLWEEVEGGYLIHDYHVYQPSAEAVRAERQKGAERKRRSRSQSQGESGSRHGGSHGGTKGESHGNASDAPVPVPNPDRSEADASDSDSGPSSLNANEQPSVSEIRYGRLSNLLADLVAENDPNGKRPTVTKRWLDAERLLLTADSRSPELVEAVIRWCQADDFERGNVLSMPKLRDRFTGLWQKSRRGRKVDSRVSELFARSQGAAA